MKRITRTLLVVALGWASAGALCTRTEDNDTNVFLTGPTALQTPPPGGGLTCLPVDRVRIVEAPGSLAVGQQHAIDVTPRDAQGAIRSDDCNDASGNQWTVEDDDVCSVDKPKAFLTFVKGLDDGDCELEACVDGKCDSIKFKVGD